MHNFYQNGIKMPRRKQAGRYATADRASWIRGQA